VSQLSRPYQVALAGALVFGLLWLLVLRPSGDEPIDAPLPTAAPVGATAPGVQGLGTAVDKADGAVTASQSAAAGTAAGAAVASGESVQPPATAAVPPAATTAPAAPASSAEPAAAQDAVDGGDPSRPILDALGKGKVAVVLFYEGRAADDRAVRRAVRELPRRGGKVRVYAAPIRHVGRYDAITRGVQVLSAPTVLVIGADRSVERILGFTQVGEIDQLVDDALRRAKASAAVGTPEAPGSA